MTTLRVRIAAAVLADDQLPQPYVCEDLDTMLRLDADAYVGCGISTARLRQAWWRKLREAGLGTYHRHDDVPVSTRLPVVHPWTAAVRLDATPATQVLGPRASQRRLQRGRRRGVTSIVAGDVGERAATYHPAQVLVARRGTVGILVVPAPGVQVVLSGEPAVATSQLRGGITAIAADLTLVAADAAVAAIRAAREYAVAPAAAHRPPRHAARACRAAP